MLSIPDLSPYKTVKETKILGVLFYTSQKVENIKLLVSSQSQKHRGLISLSKTLRAKSLTLSVYALPKFFHLARHTTFNLDTVSKCQELLNAELKKSSRQTRQKERSFISPHFRWWGRLTMPTTQTFQSEKYRFLCFRMSDQNSLLPTEFVFPKEIKNLLRNTNISIEINSSDIAIISNVTNSRLFITMQTKSRVVYYFCLQNCSFHRAAISRLCFAANRCLCSEEGLVKFTGKIWKNSMLDVWEKNFLYKFAYAVFKDREKRWFLFLENAPKCFYCNLECETLEHLIFSCPSFQPSRNTLQINNWRDVFVSTNIARLKYVVAVIRGAYSKSSTSWKFNLQTFVSWEVWKIRNGGRQNHTYAVCGCGHQAHTTSNRIVKLGTSSRKFSH